MKKLILCFAAAALAFGLQAAEKKNAKETKTTTSTTTATASSTSDSCCAGGSCSGAKTTKVQSPKGAEQAKR